MKVSDHISRMNTKKACDAKAKTWLDIVRNYLHALHRATGREYALYEHDPESRRTTVDISPAMTPLNDWMQGGKLVGASYVKYMFEQSMRQEQASKLGLEDLSKELLFITANRASDGLIHNRTGVLPYQLQDRSAEQLESALEEHAPWWPRPQLPYMNPKNMTSEQLCILIRAMVSRGYEAQQKLLSIINSSWKEYPNKTADTNVVQAMLQRMVHEDWAAGEQHAKSYACMLRLLLWIVCLAARVSRVHWGQANTATSGHQKLTIPQLSSCLSSPCVCQLTNSLALNPYLC